MVMESDTDMESVTESDTDSDWLSEKGSVKQRTERKKRRMMTRSCKNSPHASTQKMSKRPSSEPGSKILREDFRRKDQIPVTCGNKGGTLYKEEYNNGEPCILSERQWFTPSGFEKFGGKEKQKKWKTSIFYRGLQLQTLVEEGLLSSPSFKQKRTQHKEQDSPDASPVSSRKTSRLNRKTLFQSSRRGGRRKNGHTSEFSSTSESSSEHEHSSSTDDDDDDEDEDRVNVSRFQGDTFPVTCFRGKGVLHINRFAKAECGKCIRTHQAWLTPLQFLEQNRPNGNWRLDIKGRGIPIGDLIVEEVLQLHPLNCKCSICKGDPLHQLDQNNDDVCFNCNSDGDLVCCDKCPRAFHHHCHYPILQDETISDHWTCSYCLKLRNRR